MRDWRRLDRFWLDLSNNRGLIDSLGCAFMDCFWSLEGLNSWRARPSSDLQLCLASLEVGRSDFFACHTIESFNDVDCPSGNFKVHLIFKHLNFGEKLHGNPDDNHRLPVLSKKSAKNYKLFNDSLLLNFYFEWLSLLGPLWISLCLCGDSGNFEILKDVMVNSRRINCWILNRLGVFA